ncbi:MAG: hypothetical protein AABX01_04280 [Candidatus Micrarchaeota archaeon]
MAPIKYVFFSLIAISALFLLLLIENSSTGKQFPSFCIGKNSCQPAITQAALPINPRCECKLSFNTSRMNISICTCSDASPIPFPSGEPIPPEGSYFGLGEDNREIDLCNKVSDLGSRELCIAGVAKATKNLDLCQKISLTEGKTVCYIEVTAISRDWSACGTMAKEADNDECFHAKAIVNNDFAYCDKVIGQDSRRICRIYFALFDTGTGVCDVIKDPEERWDCLLSTDVKLTPELCKQFPLGSNASDHCNYIQAIGKSNSSVMTLMLCRRVKNEIMHDNCLEIGASLTSDKGMCFEIINATIRERCRG